MWRKPFWPIEHGTGPGLSHAIGLDHRSGHPGLRSLHGGGDSHDQAVRDSSFPGVSLPSKVASNGTGDSSLVSTKFSEGSLCVRRLLLAAAAFVGTASGTWAAPPRPNFVVILSDDMGFSDIGCYGGEIETPELDRLATDGLRFTQFYNTGRCCPTRASLLTGLYPHQAGVGHMMEDRGHPGYRGDLNDRCLTMAEALQPAGYRSYAVGKWHVTKSITSETEAEKHNWPLQRGFARYYGTLTGAGSYFDPATLVRDNASISAFFDPEYPSRNYYYTDAISDHAVRFIREHEGGGPFLLYVAYTAAHWPMHAPADAIAKYEGRYAAGYADVRASRYAKMLEQGVVSRNNSTLWPFPPELGEQGRFWKWDERSMEVYAAMVDRMDQGIGQIRAALEQTGRLDDTVLVYMQDNGGCAETIGRAGEGQPRPPGPTLPPLADDDVRTTLRPTQTRDGYPVRQGQGVMAGANDTFVAYGKAWSTVSNTPFRKHKHWVHEGGIATPLIVHWPKGIVAAGRLETSPGHLVDIMATMIELAGCSYPTGKIPLAGQSLLPALTGTAVDREAIYWEHEGHRAVRAGDWKLVAEHGGPWELYDLARDRSEQDDLSDQQPEVVERLADLWQAWATRANVAPWEEINSARPARR
jgi:arylsulfatase A-like enzyme